MHELSIYFLLEARIHFMALKFMCTAWAINRFFLCSIRLSIRPIFKTPLLNQAVLLDWIGKCFPTTLYWLILEFKNSYCFATWWWRIRSNFELFPYIFCMFSIVLLPRASNTIAFAAHNSFQICMADNVLKLNSCYIRICCCIIQF